MLRSLMVGTTVFTLALLTGALLSGATPARPVPTSEVTATEPAAPAGQHAAVVGADLAFAYSMIYSGAIALALSIAGMALVLRRRRLW